MIRYHEWGLRVHVRCGAVLCLLRCSVVRRQVFDDAYKSTLSVIILDDIER